MAANVLAVGPYMEKYFGADMARNAQLATSSTSKFVFRYKNVKDKYSPASGRSKVTEMKPSLNLANYRAA